MQKNEDCSVIRFTLVFSLIISACAACPIVAADKPLVVDVWPGIAPDEAGNIGEEKVRMSPKSDRKHVEVTEPTSFDQQTYEPVDDVDKINGRPDFAIAVYSGYLKAMDKDEIAPGLRVPAGTPPIFLAHGGDDIISPPEHSVLMYLALKRAGIPAEVHIYATATHDFGVRPSDHPCST